MNIVVLYDGVRIQKLLELYCYLLQCKKIHD